MPDVEFLDPEDPQPDDARSGGVGWGGVGWGGGGSSAVGARGDGRGGGRWSAGRGGSNAAGPGAAGSGSVPSDSVASDSAGSGSTTSGETGAGAADAAGDPASAGHRLRRGSPVGSVLVRRRRLLQGVAAILAAGAVTGWLLSRPSASSDHTAIGGTPTPTRPTHTATAGSPAADPPLGAVHEAVPQVLPGCAVRWHVRPGLVRQVSAVFPRASVITGASLLCPRLARSTGDPMGAERLTVLIGRLAYTIDVTRHGSLAPFEQVGYRDDQIVAGVRAQSAAVDVNIVVTGRPGTPVPSARLRALAEALSMLPSP